MPMGTRHVETGVLSREGFDLVLLRDGGGRWRLDPARKLEAYLNRRVVIEGTRCGFDELAVETIEARPYDRGD